MNEDVRKLAELGMVPQLAKELVTQIESGTTDVRRLVELTMVPELAKEVTAQISEGDSDVRRLVELTMTPVLAEFVSSLIEGAGEGSAYGLANLTSWRAFKSAHLSGANVIADLNFFGDSWTQLSSRYIEAVADALITKYGDAGGGWIGFGYPVSGQASVNGNARQSRYPVTFSGTWGSSYNGALYSPDYCGVSSTTSGSRAMVGFPAGTAAIRLFYGATFNGANAGTARYSYDNGATWTDFTLTGNNAGTLTLAGVPSDAFTLIIETVGTNSCRFAGLYTTNGAAKGVRINKLAGSGARLEYIGTGMANAVYRSQMSFLGSTIALCMYGVNDQSAVRTKEQYAGNLTQFTTGVKQISAAQDILLLSQPETFRANTVPMSDYQAACRESAIANALAHRNYQDLFGPDPSVYASSGSNPLLNPDGIHPNSAGADIIKNDILAMLDAA